MYLIPSLNKEVSEKGLHKLKKAQLIEGLKECKAQQEKDKSIKESYTDKISSFEEKAAKSTEELKAFKDFQELLLNAYDQEKHRNDVLEGELAEVKDLKNEWLNKYNKLKFKYEEEVTGKKPQTLASKITVGQVDKKTIFEKAGDKLFKFSKKRGSFATILLLISIVLLYVTIAMHITEGVELGLSYFFSSTALVIWIKKLVAVVLLSLASLFLIKINYPGLD